MDKLDLCPTVTEWLYSSLSCTYILISVHFPYFIQYFLSTAIFNCWDEGWRRCTKTHVQVHAGALLLWALVSDWRGWEWNLSYWLIKSVNMLNSNYVCVGSQLPATLAADDLQSITFKNMRGVLREVFNLLHLSLIIGCWNCLSNETQNECLLPACWAGRGWSAWICQGTRSNLKSLPIS